MFISIGFHWNNFIILHCNPLRANVFPLNMDQFGCPLLHPIDRLPDRHLMDGLTLPIDVVLELLKADRHRLEHNILHVAPHKVVKSGEEGAKLSPLLTFMTSVLSSKMESPSPCWPSVA